MPTRAESKRARGALDSRLGQIESLERFTPPRAGWIRAIRDALGMSAKELGRRMSVSHAAVFELERNERAGTVRLDSLTRAAEALDCTFVYAFVPRRGLEQAVRARAEQIAEQELRRVQHTMALEGQAEPIDAAVREEIVQQLLSSGNLWSDRP